MHVPRNLQERALAASRETEALSKRLGRSPKAREVASALGCTVEEVLEAQEVAASYEAASLDAPATRDDEEAATLVDLLGDEDPSYDLVDDRHAIATTWNELPEVEREVLELRFLHDLTQREIGEQIGYSQMHVSRLLRRALNRLERAAAALERERVLDGEALPVVVEVDEYLGRRPTAPSAGPIRRAPTGSSCPAVRDDRGAGAPVSTRR